jgi:hypothetical protein
MSTPLPEEVRLAINKAIQDAHNNGTVLDAYGVAERILQQFPTADYLLTDIVDWIIEHRPSIEAIELSPPALILEIILPAEADLDAKADVSDELIN